MNKEKTILITGGAGFIGSHVVRRFVLNYPNYQIINFDALTYAGNLENLLDITNKENYVFYKGNICDKDAVEYVFTKYNITDVIHLAAESHVDRSIESPNIFIETNVLGTSNLLNIAKDFWKDDLSKHRFHHVSTDEVYGSLKLDDKTLFKETSPYNPHSPYSASKASSDMLVKSYHDTYDMNTTISNCSNNYGPNQFPEKLIPVIINSIVNSKQIPIYGTGCNIRDWLYVEDHAEAIDLIFHSGLSGETYNIGGNCEKSNNDIVDEIIITYVNYINKQDDLSYEEIHNYINYLKSTKKYVLDRKGHDLRYAIDYTKLNKTLGWTPRTTFTKGISKTVEWYLTHDSWLQHIKNKREA